MKSEVTLLNICEKLKMTQYDTGNIKSKTQNKDQYQKGHSAVQRVAIFLCKNMQLTGQKAGPPANTARLLARIYNRLARKMAASGTETSKLPT